MALNPRTGAFDTIVGTAPDKSAGRGGGGEAVKASDIRQFTDDLRKQTLVRVFFDEVKQGYEREYNKEIASAGELLQALENPFGGFSIEKALSYLSDENQASMSRLITRGVDSYINGERNPERIFGALLQERLTTPPGTLGRSKISVPGLNVE